VAMLVPQWPGEDDTIMAESDELIHHYLVRQGPATVKLSAARQSTLTSWSLAMSARRE